MPEHRITAQELLRRHSSSSRSMDHVLQAAQAHATLALEDTLREGRRELQTIRRELAAMRRPVVVIQTGGPITEDEAMRLRQQIESLVGRVDEPGENAGEQPKYGSSTFEAERG